MKQGRRTFLGTLAAFLSGTFLGAKASIKPLTNDQIARAWEDPEYRKSLTDSQWEALPDNPAGKVDRTEFPGDLASGNSCSGNNCSGNNCSGNNCSGDNCSGNNCSGNSCSGNNCSGNNCSGYNRSGNNCLSGYYC